MKNITNYIISKTQKIKKEPEVTPGDHGFEMFNSGGTEVEIAEFLYALVRSTKPEYVLETGTHLGISSSYIALGLEHNEKGILDTYEVIPELLKQSKNLWEDLGISHRINGILQPSLSGTAKQDIDILFLDSEPQFRFDEFNRYFKDVKPGGFIIIHDLNGSMGHHGQTYHNQYDWPYGYWRDKLSKYLDNCEIQVMHLPNPRGMTIFQKMKDTDEVVRYLRNYQDDASIEIYNNNLSRIDNTVVFLHIFKNAGTSFTRTARLNYKEKEIINCNNIKFSNLTDIEKKEIKYIHGHSRYGIHNQFNQDCKYVTLLRDPVDRIISTYHFLREARSQKHPLHPVVMQLSLEECFDIEIWPKRLTAFQAYLLYDQIFNHQTRVLSGFAIPSELDLGNDVIFGQNMLDDLKKFEISEDIFLLGLSNLNQCYLVLRSEHLDKNYKLISEKLGWKLPPNSYLDPNDTHRNITVSRPSVKELSLSLYNKIVKANEYDIKLVNYIGI